MANAKTVKTAEDQPHFSVTSFDAALAFGPTRLAKSFAPTRALQLGYVDLGDDHPRPKANKEYPVVVASSEKVANVPYPQTTFRRAHLDVYKFYIDDMPEFASKNNEGLLKIQVSTKDPQNLDGSMFDAAFLTEFKGRDGSYAPTFLYRGVFRNILFQDWLNVALELYELDTDAAVYYEKIKGVIDGVPEIKDLDILKGIPYLELAANLFDSIIKTFGRNPDDHLWGELPILQVIPTPGGAFLRQGIYVLGEKFNKQKKEEMKFEEMRYVNEEVRHTKGVRLSNHLIFGISLVEHTKA